jgi:quercetin dioxygenase-like cupin family protein
VSKTNIAGFAAIDTNGLEWRKSTFADGVWVKDIAETNSQTIQLVRFEPNTSFPLHEHERPEFIYMIEGEAHQCGNKLAAGTLAIANPGTEESGFHSKDGCTFLLIY